MSFTSDFLVWKFFSCGKHDGSSRYFFLSQGHSSVSAFQQQWHVVKKYHAFGKNVEVSLTFLRVIQTFWRPFGWRFLYNKLIMNFKNKKPFIVSTILQANIRRSAKLGSFSNFKSRHCWRTSRTWYILSFKTLGRVWWTLVSQCLHLHFWNFQFPFKYFSEWSKKNATALQISTL